MQYTSAYQNMTDKALWNLAVKGDKKALSVLYKKHYELLLNFGLKYIAGLPQRYPTIYSLNCAAGYPQSNNIGYRGLFKKDKRCR